MYNKIKNKMLERFKNDVSVNFKEGDDSIVLDFIDDYFSIASDKTNRKKEDKKIYPYVYKAVKSAYLSRGDEGSSNSSEGSQSTSYIDIEDKLERDVRSIRVMK